MPSGLYIFKCLSTLLSLYIKFKKNNFNEELDLNLFLVGRGPQPPPIHGDRVGALDPDQDVTEHQPLDFRGENCSKCGQIFLIIMILTIEKGISHEYGHSILIPLTIILTQQDPHGRESPLIVSTGCLRNYRKSVLQLFISVLGRLRDLL